MPSQNSIFSGKIFEYLIYLFFILFPFVLYPSFLYAGSSSRSVNLILFSSLLAIWFGIWLFKGKSSLALAKSPIFISLAVYYLVLIISAFFGFDFSTSFWSVATRTTGLWYLAGLGFFIFTLAQFLVDRQKQDKLILVIILSTALYSMLSLFGPEGFGLFFKSFSYDAFTFGNSTFAGMYLFGTFLLAVYYLAKIDKRKWWHYLLPVLLIINPYIINHKIWLGDFSGGLAGEALASAYVILISIFFLLGIFLIFQIKQVKTKAIVSYAIGVLFFLGLALAIFSLLSSGGLINELYLKQATRARPLVWEMSAGIIKERPSLGWGIDNFEQVFNSHYDNRLLQADYGGEAWFDRAHNVIIDQAVDIGLIGLAFYLLFYLVAVFSLIYLFLNAKDGRDRILAAVLAVYFSLHLLELQTAFDTSISYPLLALMIALATVLWRRSKRDSSKNSTEIIAPIYLKYSIAVALICFFGGTLLFGWLPFVRAQVVNGYIRDVGSAEKRLPYYKTLFGSPIDEHAFLWRTSTDFERGIAENTKVLEDPVKVENLKKEILLFEEEYKHFLKEHPTHFRAHLNLADVLIYQRLFEVDKLAEAQIILDQAIKLVPQAPQSYWMKAVAYIYMAKFNLAKEQAQKALELNPKVEPSKIIIKYVEESTKTFPEIDLFFFQQT